MLKGWNSNGNNWLLALSAAGNCQQGPAIGGCITTTFYVEALLLLYLHLFGFTFLLAVQDPVKVKPVLIKIYLLLSIEAMALLVHVDSHEGMVEVSFLVTILFNTLCFGYLLLSGVQ